MGNNTVAWAMAVVVIVAVLAILGYQYMQQQLAAQRARDPATLIGSGIGNIVSGAIGLATGSN